MKGRYRSGLVWLLAFCWMANLSAQQTAGLSKGSLEEQFNYMVNESSRYQNYKVVPQAWLSTFWNNLQDSLREERGELKEDKILIKAQKKNIENFKSTQDSLNNQIQLLRDERDSLSFLGIPMEKSVYHVLVWAIIAALGAGLILFLGRFRYANSVTRKMKKDNQELQEKVEQLRKRMLEKEQELRRQLQDEINKRLG